MELLQIPGEYNEDEVKLLSDFQCYDGSRRGYYTQNLVDLTWRVPDRVLLAPAL